MAWLHQHGLISNYDDYVGLPVTVLEDARMAMEAEAIAAEAERRRNTPVAGRRRG